MAIYSSDFDENIFQVQLKSLQEYCTSLDGNTCIRCLTETLQNLKVQSHFREIFELTKLILILPETNATTKNIQFAEANEKLSAIDDEAK